MSFAQDLRASVLQAAMQGKLTEQLETDTPVHELLSNIKAEKDRLIAEKKIKKEKPLSAISDDDIPFDIPESWEWVKFGDIVYYNMGKTPPRTEPEWWKNNYPWVSISDMPESGHISKTKEMVSQKAIDEKFSKISPAGTMLMSFKLTVGRVSILDIDAVHNEAIISIYPYCDNEKITQDYLFHLLPYIANTGNTKNAIKGKTLNNDSIRNLIIPYPPIEEQKRIVRRIEEIMKHIDELEAIEEALKKLKSVFPADMKAAVLQAAMQGKLTEQLETDSSVDELLENIKKEREKLVKEGKIKKSRTKQNDNFVELDNVPFDIPSSWKWVVFENIGYFIFGYTPESEYINKTNGIPYFKVGDMNTIGNEIYLNITNNFVNKEKCRIFSKNTIVYPKNGGAIFTNKRRLLARDSVVDLNTGGFHCLNQDCLKYMFLFLQTLDFSHYYKGSALPTLDMDKIKQIPIPLPPIEEQQRIIDKLETILPLIENI